MQRLLLVTLLFLLLSVPALAKDDKSPFVPQAEKVATNSGWFVGAGFGDAQTEVIGHDRSNQISKILKKLGYSVVTATGGEHDNATTKMVRGGYYFNQYFTLEGAYQEIKGTDGIFNAIILSPAATAISGCVESEYWITSLAAIGRYPLLSWFGIYSKLGIHHWNHDLHLKGQGSGISIDRVDRHDGTNIIYGLGVDITPFTTLPVVKNISLLIGWEMLYGVENEDGIDTTTMTLQYRF